MTEFEQHYKIKVILKKTELVTQGNFWGLCQR